MASHSPTAAASQQTPSQPESRGLGVNITGRNISIWLIGSVAILLIGMAVALFDLWFQSFYYAATDNSFVEGAYVQIASPGAAQVSTLDVRQGEQVTEG